VGENPGGFLGQTLRLVELGGLRVTVVDYPSAHASPLHAHDHPYFTVPLRGPLVEDHGLGIRTFGAKDVLYRPAGLEHRASNPGPHRALNVELLSGEPLRIATSVLARPSDHHDGPVRHALRRLIDELRHPDDLSSLVVGSLGLELVVSTARSERRKGSRPDWMQGVEDRLRVSLESPPSLEELAREAGVHPSHLARQFRREHGTTVGGYVRAARVAEAKRLLVGTTLTIGEIAALCGFADQAHLARVFRRETGVSASEYRSSAR